MASHPERRKVGRPVIALEKRRNRTLRVHMTADEAKVFVDKAYETGFSVSHVIRTQLLAASSCSNSSAR